MKLELFRPEARRVPRQRLEGAVVLATPPSSLAMTAFIAALVGCLVLGAAFVPIYRSERAVGWIVPTEGFVRLAAQRAGFVSHIAVEEGDPIEAGEPLVAVRTSSEGEGQDSAGRLEETMSAQARADTQTARASAARLRLEHGQVERRVGMLNATLAESANRLDLQRQRLTIAEAELRRGEEIASKGFLPTRELEARRASALAAAQELSATRQAQIATEMEIADARARLRAIAEDLSLAQAEAERSATTLARQVITTRSDAGYTIASTVSGSVGVLPVALGQALSAGDVVAVLLPGTDALEAEVFVSSAASASLRIGLPVTLEVDGVASGWTTPLRGRVNRISTATLRPDDLPFTMNELDGPLYRLTLAMDDPEGKALRPGMRLRARIMTERMTLLQWAFTRRGGSSR
ncbi:HlyD family secretion protein (plasmid) [Brevundimonas staleyi]|uniref:HlyD family secretion protein n=1 Tax=Brevundimonas staleyi TaxID=74326 RepID=A0ABW0FMR6_9CAUL